MLESDEIAWRPTPEYVERSRLRRFIEQHGLADYQALLDRADADPAWFWGAVVEDLGLEWSRPYSAVLDMSQGPQWPRWFVDGGFNYVANGLERHVTAGLGDRDGTPPRDFGPRCWALTEALRSGRSVTIDHIEAAKARVIASAVGRYRMRGRRPGPCALDGP